MVQGMLLLCMYNLFTSIYCLKDVPYFVNQHFLEDKIPVPRWRYLSMELMKRGLIICG